MNEIIYPLVYIAGVLMAASAQIMLKKSAGKTFDSKLKEYLNIPVLAAYAIFFVSTLCTVFAYRNLPLALGPILGATEYIFVAIFSRVFLQEKVAREKLAGLVLIVIGVLICTI